MGWTRTIVSCGMALALAVQSRGIRGQDGSDKPTLKSPTSAATDERDWWKNATIYEIYPRSFQDLNGDGVGDLDGITERLDYLKQLGVDAIWLTPIYSSPQVDFGYDISDYKNIDPQYGTLADFDRLVAEARKRQIRVVMDMVMNHTSNIAVFAYRPARANVAGMARDSFNEMVADPLGTYHQSPAPPELVKNLVDCRRATSKASASRYPFVDKLSARPSGIRNVSGLPDVFLINARMQLNRVNSMRQISERHIELSLPRSDYRPERRGDSRSDHNGYRNLDQYSTHRRHELQGVLFLSGVSLEFGEETL
jgi:hypothetical protein